MKRYKVNEPSNPNKYRYDKNTGEVVFYDGTKLSEILKPEERDSTFTIKEEKCLVNGTSYNNLYIYPTVVL